MKSATIDPAVYSPSLKRYTAHLKSITPYSQSKPHFSEKLERELDDAYDKRTAREHLHYDAQGQVYIPATSLKNSLSEAGKFLGKKIPGAGKSTYTKHLESGVMILDNCPLGIDKESVSIERLYLNSDGVRGSGKRVWRCFPRIDSWETDVTLTVLDQILTGEVLCEHLVTSGMLIGIGRFRPRNNGFYGRFTVVSFQEV